MMNQSILKSKNSNGQTSEKKIVLFDKDKILKGILFQTFILQIGTKVFFLLIIIVFALNTCFQTLILLVYTHGQQKQKLNKAPGTVTWYSTLSF